ncbi:MAG: hypothetical protein GY855_06890, partial [candidate division Zixibacteria bacterium]|nr:hypothetical protein [candidate division Zixibacteria bacterium]
MKFDEDRYIITDNGNVGKIALVLFILGLVSSVAGYMFDSKQFFHSYLVSFMFWTSISLGGLFMVMIH